MYVPNPKWLIILFHFTKDIVPDIIPLPQVALQGGVFFFSAITYQMLIFHHFLFQLSVFLIDSNHLMLSIDIP